MNRQENLIQILLKAEKPLTTQELAEHPGSFHET